MGGASVFPPGIDQLGVTPSGYGSTPAQPGPDGTQHEAIHATLKSAVQALENIALSGTSVAWLNLKNYGTNVGSGGDDTAAINAWAADAALKGAMMYAPAGTYHYNGTGITGAQIAIRGDDRALTTFVMGASSFLISDTQKWNSLRLEDITFSGGLGAFRHLFSGINVTNEFSVIRCNFLNYTQIGGYTLASDMPYWHFYDCEFQGASDFGTMGFCHSGKTDSCSWISCAFTNNAVGLKLLQGGDSAFITDCEFIRLSAYMGHPRIGVWVVPSATYSPSGQGLNIQSKFGGENLNAADIPVLYADEAPGSGDHSQLFPQYGRVVTDGVMDSSTTLSSATANFTTADIGANVQVKQGLEYGLTLTATIVSIISATAVTLSSSGTAGSVSGLTAAIGVSLGFITGHLITGCEVGGANPSPCFIYSTAFNLRGCRWGPLCFLPNPPSPVLQLLVQPDPDANNGNNVLGPFYGDGVGISALTNVIVSNVLGVYRLDDPWGYVQSAHKIPQITGEDMVGYVDLTANVSAGIQSWSYQGGSSYAPANNYFGVSSAATVTLPSTAAAVQALLGPSTAVIAGKPIYIAFSIKAAVSSPLSVLQFAILEGVPGGGIHLQQQIQMTADWRPIIICFIPRVSGDVNLIAQFSTPSTGSTGSEFVVDIDGIYTNEMPINVQGRLPALNIQGPQTTGHNPVLQVRSTLTQMSIDAQDPGVGPIPLMLNPSGGMLRTNGPYRMITPNGANPYQVDFAVGANGLSIQAQESGVGSSPILLNGEFGGDLGMGNPFGYGAGDEVGFFFMPSSPGTPTGFPFYQSVFPNAIACRIDPVNGKFCAYYGGAWHFLTFSP
jgi:hypothetical protein